MIDFAHRSDDEIRKIMHLASPWPAGDEAGPVAPPSEVIADMAREILFRRAQVIAAHRGHRCPGIDVCMWSMWPEVKP